MTRNEDCENNPTSDHSFRPDSTLQRSIHDRRGSGIEPEITAKVAKLGVRIYEVSVSYRGRTYAEGKKIGWKDGVRAIVAIVKYGLLR